MIVWRCSYCTETPITLGIVAIISVLGLFTLPDADTDSDSDSDCKPNGYIILCRTLYTARV